MFSTYSLFATLRCWQCCLACCWSSSCFTFTHFKEDNSGIWSWTQNSQIPFWAHWAVDDTDIIQQQYISRVWWVYQCNFYGKGQPLETALRSILEFLTKPQQSPSETYIGQNFLFHKFEMKWSVLIDMVLLSQNIITSLSVEEVVQCSLPWYQKNSTTFEANPESECHRMPAALPSNSQAHKRGLNSRQMVVDGEHCEPARSSARPSSVVTLRENNRPCRCGHISRKHCVSCCPLPKVIRQAAAGRWHRCRTEIDRESRSRTRKLRKTGGRAWLANCYRSSGHQQVHVPWAPRTVARKVDNGGKGQQPPLNFS